MPEPGGPKNSQELYHPFGDLKGLQYESAPDSLQSMKIVVKRTSGDVEYDWHVKGTTADPETKQVVGVHVSHPQIGDKLVRVADFNSWQQMPNPEQPVAESAEHEPISAEVAEDVGEAAVELAKVSEPHPHDEVPVLDVEPEVDAPAERVEPDESQVDSTPEAISEWPGLERDKAATTVEPAEEIIDNAITDLSEEEPVSSVEAAAEQSSEQSTPEEPSDEEKFESQRADEKEQRHLYTLTLWPVLERVSPIVDDVESESALFEKRERESQLDALTNQLAQLGSRLRSQEAVSREQVMRLHNQLEEVLPLLNKRSTDTGDTVGRINRLQGIVEESWEESKRKLDENQLETAKVMKRQIEESVGDIRTDSIVAANESQTVRDRMAHAYQLLNELLYNRYGHEATGHDLFVTMQAVNQARDVTRARSGQLRARLDELRRSLRETIDQNES